MRCVTAELSCILQTAVPAGYEVVIYGGSHPTSMDAIAWAQDAAVRRGAGEILLTSMEADGVRTGFDLEITAKISDNVDVPVIASGGVGTLEHFYDGFVIGKADACLAASVFHYGEMTVRGVKEYLAARGVAVWLQQRQDTHRPGGAGLGSGRG